MQMNEGLTIAMAALAGMLLGAAFFGGLWWTVRRGAASSRAGLWFALSFMLRTALVLGGFYLAGGGAWPRLLACMAGFLAARAIALRLCPPPIMAASHAP